MNGISSCNILIIDDDPVDREVYVRYLSQIHSIYYKIHEAETVQQGIGLYQTGTPDCILLDYNLPDGSGLDFITSVANIDGSLDIPIILLTGQGSETIAANSIKLGAKDYLVKNKLNPRILHSAIKNATHTEEAVPFAQHLPSQHCAIPPKDWLKI